MCAPARAREKPSVSVPPFHLEGLAVIQFPVQRAGGIKFRMSAVPDDAAALKHQNARRHADGAEAVGYDESRPSLHQAVQLLLDLGLAFRVQGGGGFIQNQDGGVFQEGCLLYTSPSPRD